MSVGSVGGMGGMSGGLGMTGVSGGAGSVSAGGSATIDSTPVTALSPQMQQLVELMEGMNSAQILMALMLAAGNKDDDKNSGAVMAFMAGMMLGAGMNAAQTSLCCQFDGAGNISGTTGASFNALA